MEEKWWKDAKIRIRYLKASVTVETSYIMPIILGIIFAVMAVSFYFHDIVISQAVLDKNTAKMKNILMHPFENETYYYDYSIINERFLYSIFENYSKQEMIGIERIKKELKELLITMNVQNINIKIKNKKITASIELCYTISLPGSGYIPFFKRTKKIQSCRFVYYQADFARLLEKTEEQEE